MIINPITSQNIPLYSKEAKYLLKSYIKRYYQKNQTGGSLCNYSLIYMAKPRYGGWVSFTAHLSRKFNLPIYKISKTTEQSQRDFGYGATYQNISIETAKKLKNILITAIDKNYYEYLSQLPKSTSLVIHDPTEVKGASCQPVLDVLHKFKIYTIRKTVQKFLQSTYQVNSQFKLLLKMYIDYHHHHFLLRTYQLQILNLLKCVQLLQKFYQIYLYKQIFCLFLSLNHVVVIYKKHIDHF